MSDLPSLRVDAPGPENAVEFYKRDREALVRDTWRAEAYIRGFAGDWPRLGEVADVLRAWQEAE